MKIFVIGGVAVPQGHQDHDEQVRLLTSSMERLGSDVVTMGHDLLACSQFEDSADLACVSARGPDHDRRGVTVLRLNEYNGLEGSRRRRWGSFFDQHSQTDVKAGLYWLQAALNLPLKPGSRVLVVSSGAAQNGSPLSGGYAGAKRMLWFMANDVALRQKPNSST
jgi:NAD(P)-dependent dehydrogenase (short-subunit alcohol dehydrogenase family)